MIRLIVVLMLTAFGTTAFADNDPAQDPPANYVSSNIVNSVLTGLFLFESSELNYGYSINKQGAIQVGFAYENSVKEGDGTKVETADPNDQFPDDTDNLERSKSREYTIGYMHRLRSYGRTGMSVGALLTLGSSETVKHDRTQVYTENYPQDFSQTLISSETKSNFQRFTIRAEAEHHFTHNIAVGITQDFYYENRKEEESSRNLTRQFSSDVQSGIDDPTETKTNSKIKDTNTVFRGLFVRMYF
jgi:hypothetical protein